MAETVKSKLELIEFLRENPRVLKAISDFGWSQWHTGTQNMPTGDATEVEVAHFFPEED